MRKKDLIPIRGQYKFDWTPSSDKKPAYGYLEIPCETALQFSARFEKSADKWAKKWGISHEFEIGHSSFDDEVYLASVTETDAELLGTNREIPRLILKVLEDIGTKGSYHLQNELICDGKFLHLKIAYKTENSEHKDEFVDKKLETLKSLSKLLSEFKPFGLHFWKVPTQRNTAIILAISSAFAILGIVEAVKLFFSGNQLFSPFSLARESLMLAVLGVFLLVAALFKFVNKSARRHLVLLEILISGSFGLVFSAYGWLYDLNIDFDKSPKEVRAYKVADKYSEHHRGRKGRSYYTYHLRFNNAESPVESNIKISSDLYSEISAGDTVKLVIRKGYLNKPWLESITRCNDCNDNEF